MYTATRVESLYRDVGIIVVPSQRVDFALPPHLQVAAASRDTSSCGYDSEYFDPEQKDAASAKGYARGLHSLHLRYGPGGSPNGA